jgi:hypothetical protein
MRLKKKVSIFLLFVITSLLAATSVYVGIQLSETPDTAPIPSSAQQSTLLQCESGFRDDFSLTTLDTTYWEFSSLAHAQLDFSNQTLKLTLSSPTVSQSAFVNTINSYSGNFRVTVDIKPIIIPSGSNNASGDLIFYNTDDEVNPVRFRIRRERNGILQTDKLIATGANEKNEIELSPSTGDIRVTLEREGNVMRSFYSISGVQSPLLSVSDMPTNEGQFALFALNLQENTAIIGAEFDNFELACIQGNIIVPTTVSPTSVFPSITPTVTPIIVTIVPTMIPTPIFTPTAVPLPETSLLNGNNNIIFAIGIIILGLLLLIYSTQINKAKK